MPARIEVDIYVPKRITVFFGSRGYSCKECGHTEALDYTPEDGAVLEMAEKHLKTHYYLEEGYTNWSPHERGFELSKPRVAYD